MRHAIKLLTVGLLLSSGLFATAPLKHINPKILSNKRMVTFRQMPAQRGIEIKLTDPAVDKALVTIYDWNNDVVWKQMLSPKKGLDKGFVLNQLDNGNYTIQVTVNDQLVAKRTAHVYYRGDWKYVTLRA